MEIVSSPKARVIECLYQYAIQKTLARHRSSAIHDGDTPFQSAVTRL
jgi:hypothetical protein